VDRSLLDFYRTPADAFGSSTGTADHETSESGFFQFGLGNICYGRCQVGVAATVAESGQFNALKCIQPGGATIQLPFSFSEVIENLRRERYRGGVVPGSNLLIESKGLTKFYYLIRDQLPVSFRRKLQRIYFSDWRSLKFPAWPVDFTVDALHEEFLRLLMETSGNLRVPFVWFWPEGASNCLILTHDVETSAGRDFTSELMDLDHSFGFKASFQVIPEKRYEVPETYVQEIRSRGFEFNIHDLNHDGQLYLRHEEFVRRAARINSYARKYGSRGFRAGSMYRNQEWYEAFEFSYDMSVPNVAHLEPMRGGCCTVMPYFIGEILELPLTTSGDYSLFHILSEYSIDLWKQQLALIRRKHGLMSVLVHPDYLLEQRARKTYESMLDYLREMVARESTWVALPGDVDRWWRARSQMRVVSKGNEWEIVGPEKNRARLAYATLEDGRLVYDLATPRERAIL